VVVFLRGEEVSKLLFSIDADQITVSSFNTEEEYQRCGFGSIAMEAVFGIARTLELPVYLYSAANAVPFYKKLGFHRVIECHWKGVEPDDKEPDSEDMVWLPQSLYRRRHIILHV
jgi:GNAT superfamily N-acetyltransferase